MIVIYEEEYLRQLYEQGKCNDKKHRFQPDIIRRYKRAIDFLIAANCIEDLWKYRALKYEALSGDKAGISSIRVNDTYRIEFTVRTTIEEPILTICNIVKLSNHYK